MAFIVTNSCSKGQRNSMLHSLWPTWTTQAFPKICATKEPGLPLGSWLCRVKVLGSRRKLITFHWFKWNLIWSTCLPLSLFFHSAFSINQLLLFILVHLFSTNIFQILSFALKLQTSIKTYKYFVLAQSQYHQIWTLALSHPKKTFKFHLSWFLPFHFLCRPGHIFISNPKGHHLWLGLLSSDLGYDRFLNDSDPPTNPK